MYPLSGRAERRRWINTGYTAVLVKDEPGETCYHKSAHRRFQQPSVSPVNCDQHISGVLITGTQEPPAIRRQLFHIEFR